MFLADLTIVKEHLFSITTLTRLAIPHLEEAKGNVVNVSSFGSQKAVSKTPAQRAIQFYWHNIPRQKI